MLKPEIFCLSNGIAVIADAEGAPAGTFVRNVKINLMVIAIYDICCHDF